MRRSGLLVSLISALSIAVATLAGCILGFGSYLRTAWIVILPVLILIAGAEAAIISRISGISQPWRSGGLGIVFAMPFLLAGWFGGGEIRLARCRATAEKADPLLQAIEAHRREKGALPKSLSEIRDWERIVAASGLAVSERRLREDGFETSEIDHCELALFLGENECVAVVPVERMVPMSFTSFQVLIRDSRAGTWRADKMTWRLNQPSR